MDDLYFLTGKTSDQIWDEANDFVDQMPEGLIEKHHGRLTKLFTIHAKTLQAEIRRRAPDETFMVEALDYVLNERILKGKIREALRDLAIGVIANLPQKQSMDLDPRFEGMLGSTTDKNTVLYQSTTRHGTGIMPATVRFMFECAHEDAAVFYRANMDKIFPNPQGIVPVIQ